MKSKAAACLLSLNLLGCGSPKVTPHFKENKAAYQLAIHSIINSDTFRRYSQRKQVFELAGMDVDSIADLAAVNALFQMEPIDHIRIEPDTSVRFSFPTRETALGLGMEGSALIYLPNRKYWHLPNSKISNTTLNKNEYLGEGWFQSEWANNLAD